MQRGYCMEKWDRFGLAPSVAASGHGGVAPQDPDASLPSRSEVDSVYCLGGTILAGLQMWANKIVDSLIGAMALVVVPIQIVFTIPLGCLVLVTLGLYLIPVSFIWTTLFLGPLIGLSWLWDKIPLLRIPAAILGIPAAVLGDAYTAVMPSMGEESRVTRVLICRTWPFSREFLAFTSLKAAPTSDLREVLSRLASRNPEIGKFIREL
jgi:hypothetical protein